MWWDKNERNNWVCEYNVECWVAARWSCNKKNFNCWWRSNAVAQKTNTHTHTRAQERKWKCCTWPIYHSNCTQCWLPESEIFAEKLFADTYNAHSTKHTAPPVLHGNVKCYLVDNNFYVRPETVVMFPKWRAKNGAGKIDCTCSLSRSFQLILLTQFSLLILAIIPTNSNLHMKQDSRRLITHQMVGSEEIGIDFMVSQLKLPAFISDEISLHISIQFTQIHQTNCAHLFWYNVPNQLLLTPYANWIRRYSEGPWGVVTLPIQHFLLETTQWTHNLLKLGKIWRDIKIVSTIWMHRI